MLAFYLMLQLLIDFFDFISLKTCEFIEGVLAHRKHSATRKFCLKSQLCFSSQNHLRTAPNLIELDDPLLLPHNRLRTQFKYLID